MKIVCKNKTRIIAIHEGMPFVFFRQICEQLINADLAFTTNWVGVFIDNENICQHIYNSDDYFKLFQEVWRV